MKKVLGSALGAVGSILGIGGSKKTATPTPTPAASGPIVKKLGAGSGTSPVVKKLRDRIAGQPTILSDKLGN